MEFGPKYTEKLLFLDLKICLLFALETRTSELPSDLQLLSVFLGLSVLKTNVFLCETGLERPARFGGEFAREN